MNDVEKIVIGMQNQEEWAFQEFYESSYKNAHVYVMRMVKNEEIAMDLLQDAYIKAYKNIHTLQDPRTLYGWFKTIVHRTTKDYLKKKKPLLFQQLDTEEMNFEDSLENENESFVPEASMDYSETKKLIGNILDNLSEEQRMCVLLYYYESLSVKEIAQEMECSENTVKSRLNYARKKIKEDVLELEKKGTKLYGIAPIPFLVWMLKTEEFSYGATELYGNVLTALHGGSETAGAAAASAATETVTGTVSGAATGSAAGGVSKAAGGMITAIAGKGLATKIIIGVLAVTLAIGTGIGGKTIFDSHQEKKMIRQQEEAEQAIMNALDEEELTGMFYYLPLFDQEDPVTDEEMEDFVRDSLLDKYLEHDYSPYSDEDVAELVKDHDSSPKGYAYITIKQNVMSEMARKIGFHKKLDNEFFVEVAKPYNTMISSDEKGISLRCDGLGGFFYDYEVSLDEINPHEGKILVHYTFTELDYTQADAGVIETEWKRTATLEQAADSYVITSITEYDPDEKMPEQTSEEQPEANAFDDLDAEYLKGLLAYAISEEEDDETMNSKMSYILLYKYLKLERPDLVKETEANPLRDQDVKIVTAKDSEGYDWPAIQCDVAVLNRIAKTYGYNKDIGELMVSKNSYYIDVENGKLVYRIAGSGAYYNLEVVIEDQVIDGNEMTVNYRTTLKFVDEYGEDSRVSRKQAVVEATEEGYLIKDVIEQ